MPNDQNAFQPLGEIADITMGATSRFYSESPTSGGKPASLLTGTCLDNRGNVIADNAKPVWMLDGANRYIPKTHDVLIVARGRIRALAVSIDTFDELPTPALVSANYAIVRIKQQRFNAEYIAELFSNKRFMENMGFLFGTAIPSLGRAALNRARIPVLDSEQQQAIADLRQAREKAHLATLDVLDHNTLAANTLIEEMIWGRS